MPDKIGEIDLAVVLGSGLSNLLSARASFISIPYHELGIPVAPLPGHAGMALVGRLHGRRVLVFAGRIHSYQGFDAREVTRHIGIAADRGAKSVLLTNAAGAIAPWLAAGDVMAVSDHINLSGQNPLVGNSSPNPFVDMSEAYAPRLRKLAHEIDGELKEGVYACMLGPTYETNAEARFLRTIGADAVGMSTVLETIAARARGLEVFAASVITNTVGGEATTHAQVTEAAKTAAPRLAALIDGLIERI